MYINLKYSIVKIKKCKNEIKNKVSIILNSIEKSIDIEILHTTYSCIE